MLVVTDATTRAEIEALLAEAVYDAKRQMPKVGGAEHPTPWDDAHALIDALLGDRERARG